MRRNRSVSVLGFRTAAARVETLGPQDITMRGTYWYDLHARRPLAAAMKRLLDVVISVPALVLFAPMFLFRRVERVRCVGFRGTEFELLRFQGRAMKSVPQFVNVLHGSMSLVGPRPLEPGEAETREGRRFTVKPGITGPWRVTDGLERERELDRRYVNEWSGPHDLAILLRTLLRL